MAKVRSKYCSGRYWADRKDLIYYQYLYLLVRCVGARATSLIDVGTGSSPYMEWFDWITQKVSIDVIEPYRSRTVRGIIGNIIETKLDRRYSLCTCLQVLEHVEDPVRFARRLLEISDLTLISVPHNWPSASTAGHRHDPVDLQKIVRWFGRRPNYSISVSEPFLGKKSARLFALFDNINPTRRFGTAVWRGRKPITATRCISLLTNSRMGSYSADNNSAKEKNMSIGSEDRLTEARRRRLYVEPRLKEIASELAALQGERNRLRDQLSGKADDASYKPARERRSYVISRISALEREQSELRSERNEVLQTIRAAKA